MLFDFRPTIQGISSTHPVFLEAQIEAEDEDAAVELVDAFRDAAEKVGLTLDSHYLEPVT